MDTAFKVQEDVIAHKTLTQGWISVTVSAFLVVEKKRFLLVVKSQRMQKHSWQS